jgi:hypothetical protein
MRGRCLNPKNRAFREYGAKGISICQQWVDDFDQFYADMGDRPAAHTLERERNELGYSPDNCRWATRAEQVKNRGYTASITHAGHTRTLGEWADHLGVPYYTLWNRIRSQGMSPEKALTAERLVAKQWTHGSLTGYAKGCRCNACTAKRAEWYLKHNEKKRGS